MGAGGKASQPKLPHVGLPGSVATGVASLQPHVTCGRPHETNRIDVWSGLAVAQHVRGSWLWLAHLVARSVCPVWCVEKELIRADQ